MFHDDAFDLDKVIGRRHRILQEQIAKRNRNTVLTAQQLRPEEMIYKFCIERGHPPTYVQILDMLPPEVREKMKATRAKMDAENESEEQPRKRKTKAAPSALAPAPSAMDIGDIRRLTLDTLDVLAAKCGRNFAREFMKDLLAQHGAANVGDLDPKSWPMFANACELAKLAPLHRTAKGESP